MTAGDLTIGTRSQGRAPARAAWALWLLTLGFCALAVLLQLSSDGYWVPGAYGFPGFTSIFAIAFGTVGTIVLANRPDNRVGRILLVAGLVAGFQSLYSEYGIVANVSAPGSLPFGEIAAWLVAWAWLPFVYLAGPLLLSVFPDGRFLSRRWALGPAIAAVAGIGFACIAAFRIGPLENFASVSNPFGVVPADVAAAAQSPLAAALGIGFVVPAASLVVRYRRSDGDRRHQLKWIALAAVVLALVAPAGFSLGKAGQVTFIVALSGVPIAAGIAVLRYRLYEVDTIINRALVYGSLTAIIAGLYTASIGLMQRVSQAILGGDSQATIVVTTVVIVAAFTPIKTRLQAVVDRRFREARDPRAALDAFVTQLRGRTWPLDRRLVIRQLVAVVTTGLGSEDAAATLVMADETVSEAVGQASSATTSWTTTGTAPGVRLELRLGVAGRQLSDRDATAIGSAVTAVAEELSTG